MSSLRQTRDNLRSDFSIGDFKKHKLTLRRRTDGLGVLVGVVTVFSSASTEEGETSSGFEVQVSYACSNAERAAGGIGIDRGVRTRFGEPQEVGVERDNDAVGSCGTGGADPGLAESDGSTSSNVIPPD